MCLSCGAGGAYSKVGRKGVSMNCYCGCGESFESTRTNQLYAPGHRLKMHCRARELGLRVLRGTISRELIDSVYAILPDPTGDQLREDGLQAVMNAPKNAELRSALESCLDRVCRQSLRTGRAFTADDVWSLHGNGAGAGSPNIMGGIFAQAARAGRIVRAGYGIVSERQSARKRIVAAWRPADPVTR